MIGFTQSSYPAYYLPSDEDYKTLSFVISLQRWVKDLEYAKFWLIFFKTVSECQHSAPTWVIYGIH